MFRKSNITMLPSQYFCGFTGLKNEEILYSVVAIEETLTSTIYERIHVESERTGIGDLIYKAEIETRT